MQAFHNFGRIFLTRCRIDKISRSILTTLNVQQKVLRNFQVKTLATIANAETKHPTSDLECATIKSAINNDKEITVTWEDGTKCSYPHIFLRDNCLCPKCLHSESGSRILETFKQINLNIEAKSFKMENNEIVIEWPDNHKSVFESSWLYERHFPQKRLKTRDNVPFGLKQVYWNNEMLSKNPPFIDYQDWLNDDEAVIKHIETLITHGVCVIKGAPAEENFSESISGHMAMGFNKPTHYGHKEIMKSKAAVSNIAYSGLELSLHNDMAYLKNQPDLQFLHCIEQSTDEPKSGANLIVDGFYVANMLRKENKKAFDLLTTTVFPANDNGTDIHGDFHMFYQRPIIRIDDNGDLVGLCFNNYSRSSFVYAPQNEVFEVYEAMYALYEQLVKEEHVWCYKMEPGDILTFSNKRILHARLGFDPTKTFRWLETGYLDWDNVLGKYRVLKAKNHGYFKKL